MSFTTSINIERDFGKTPHYIVTANARQTIGKIMDQRKNLRDFHFMHII